MPIFEFRCTACHLEFEEVVLGDETVTCPKCKKNVEKLISSGNFRTGGPIVKGSPSANAIITRGQSKCAGCKPGAGCSTCK